REEDLRDEDDPEVTRHGSISMMVNYHAISRYFALLGGESLQTSYRHHSIHVAAFLLGGPVDGFLETRSAYSAAVERFGPDDFFSLKKALEPHYSTLTIEQLLSAVRLGGWDANILYGAAPALFARLPEADELQRQELYEAVQRVRDLYYPIG